MRRDTAEILELADGAPPWPPAWTAQSVVGALEPLVSEQRRERLSTVIARRTSSVTVVMDAPHDPHNAAAVLRSCDAFGVPDLHVVLRDEAFQVGRRVAKGAERWVTTRIHRRAEDAIDELARRGFQLVVSHPRGELSPDDLSKLERVALVLGNEHDGVRAALAAAATASVRVPMRGFVESLNVSVSAGILLQAATRGRPGDLSPERRRRLYAEGLFHSVPRAAEVLDALRPGPGS
jgi:tRNA (guanosine-2'-O-)-methyltransferase